MSIDVSKRFIRTLFKELFNHEVKAINLKVSKGAIVKKIGKVVFNHSKKTGSVDLYERRFEKDETHESYASLVLFEDGKTGIMIRDDIDLFTNVRLIPALLGVIAHEVGHYINGDLDKKSEEEEFAIRSVGTDISKQKDLYDKGSANSYVRSVISATLKGGVLQAELAADITAVQLNGLPNLLMAKMLDDDQTENMLVFIEKRNRVNHLIGMMKDGSLSHEKDSSIDIVFD